MGEFATPLTTDDDVFAFEPSLSGSNAIIGKIDKLHEAASDEIARFVRVRWWGEVLRSNRIPPQYLLPYIDNDNGVPMLSLSGMDTSKLSRTQLYRLAVYRLLGWHVWPMLDTHNDEETYAQKRSKFWKQKFEEEAEDILNNGIAYDWDGDGVAEMYDDATVPASKSCRLERA